MGIIGTLTEKVVNGIWTERTVNGILSVKNVVAKWGDAVLDNLSPEFVSAEIGLVDASTIAILMNKAMHESRVPDLINLIPRCSGGRYSDWFLGSRDEVDLMRTVLHDQGIGGFSNTQWYWSSSEVSSTNATAIDFSNGEQYDVAKGSITGLNVRACRAFTSATVYALRDVGPAGGWIFYKDGNDYLEAAPADTTDAKWSNITNLLIGTTGTAIGTGQANTDAIIGQAGHTGSAAKNCDIYSAGYNDVVTAIVISGLYIYATLGREITPGEEITIQYVLNALEDKQLQGINLGKVLPFTEDVTNNITIVYPVLVPPVIIEDEVPTKIKIPYDLALDETSVPATSAYVLGSGRTFTLLEVIGQNVYGTVSSRYYQGDTETIAYTKPATNMIKSLAGNEAESFTATEVTNQVILLAPLTNLTAVWINDFARLTVDNIPSDVQVEWEESEDNVTYVPVTTTGLDVVTTDDYTWQNQLMYFRARAKRGIYYSDYITPVSLLTPLVFKTNQSTLTLLRFSTLNILAGKTVTINYGDGSAPVVKSGNNSNVDYNYSVQSDPYYVQLLGSDNNAIQMLYCHSQLTNYGDLSKWVLIAGMTRLFLHQSSFTGTILQFKNLPSGLQYLGLYPTAGQPMFSGTIKAQTLPSGMIQMSLNGANFSGDMSGVLISNSVTNGIFNINGNTAITKAFRGRFDNITQYNFATNALNTAELDSLFADIDASLTTYPPTVSTTYTLNGAGNGIPTGGALNANIVSIKAKYVTAGFVATILINS